ncbi:MAG TPA: GTP-binding protein, partial [Chloroflexota bacterium]
MKVYSAAQIRNLGLFGHGSAGKTSIVEALLFTAGAIPRMGKIEDGTTTTDHDPDEIRHKMTISVGLAPLEWRDHKINLVDAPGYADFFGEVAEAMRIIDCALIVVEAVSGVQVGTVAAWNEADSHSAPRMVFVNKMERENADYGKVLEQLRQRWGVGVIPLTVPIGAEHEFKGVIDLARFQAFLDDKKGPEAVPADLADSVAAYREM